MSSVHLSLLTIGSGIAVVAALSGPPALSRHEYEPPLLPRPELLKVLGNAQRHMLADYYWVLTTEATGRAYSRYEYRDIADYAEIVSELDPKFRYIYVFAGVSVPYNLGRETWVNTDESTRILSKGFLQFPDYVYLRILLAYNLSCRERRATFLLWRPGSTLRPGQSMRAFHWPNPCSRTRRIPAPEKRLSVGPKSCCWNANCGGWTGRLRNSESRKGDSPPRRSN